MNDLVGVCVAAYNRERYLPECLDSLLSNDYPNFHIFVTADGSVDSTEEIIKDYEKKTGKITNLGNNGTACVGTSKRRCVEAAIKHGCKYIQLLDSDDRAKPQLLSRMVSFLKEKGTDWANCDGQSIGAGTMKLVSHADVTLEQEVEQNMLTSWGTFKAETLQKENYREGLVNLDDWELWIRLLKAGFTYSVLNEPLVEYRWHDEQLTRIWNTDAMKAKKAEVVSLIRKLNGIER